MGYPIEDKIKYQTGDIIVVRGTIFKENGLYDTKIYGRPVIVLWSDEDIFYYLTMSSRTENIDIISQCFVLEHERWHNKKNHYGNVNCKNIYKKNVEYHSVRTNLERETLARLLYKFKRYQETVKQDEFYDEVKDKIKQYIR